MLPAELGGGLLGVGASPRGILLRMCGLLAQEPLFLLDVGQLLLPLPLRVQPLALRLLPGLPCPVQLLVPARGGLGALGGLAAELLGVGLAQLGHGALPLGLGLRHEQALLLELLAGLNHLPLAVQQLLLPRLVRVGQLPLRLLAGALRALDLDAPPLDLRVALRHGLRALRHVLQGPEAVLVGGDEVGLDLLELALRLLPRGAQALGGFTIAPRYLLRLLRLRAALGQLLVVLRAQAADLLVVILQALCHGPLVLGLCLQHQSPLLLELLAGGVEILLGVGKPPHEKLLVRRLLLALRLLALLLLPVQLLVAASQGLDALRHLALALLVGLPDLGHGSLALVLGLALRLGVLLELPLSPPLLEH
mmetsp:Transcript_47906/g.135359  ORF Transcript_47906/g.135359 Transcript_47906/m.135359 type:complete len:365 (-) Transcript_47906:361-1455(-)